MLLIIEISFHSVLSFNLNLQHILLKPFDQHPPFHPLGPVDKCSDILPPLNNSPESIDSFPEPKPLQDKLELPSYLHSLLFLLLLDNAQVLDHERPLPILLPLPPDLLSQVQPEDEVLLSPPL